MICDKKEFQTWDKNVNEIEEHECLKTVLDKI